MLQEVQAPEVVSAGCDYITLTAKHGTHESITLAGCFDGLRLSEQFDGIDEKADAAMGYRGTSIGQMFYGSSRQGVMLRASGGAAQSVLECLHNFKEVPHVTRIDCQITVDVGVDTPDLPEQTRQAVILWQAEKRLLRPPRTTIIDTNGYGNSISIGKRSSEIFVRIYDKTREMKREGPPWLWRFEVELKARHAERALQAIMEHATAASGAYAVADAYLIGRGVPSIWPASHSFVVPQFEHVSTNEQKQLAWLASAVRPTVRRLVRRGLHREVQRALWLLDTEQDV